MFPPRSDERYGSLGVQPEIKKTAASMRTLSALDTGLYFVAPPVNFSFNISPKG